MGTAFIFCRPGTPVTMQAFSEDDRNQWLEALDGKEAVSIELLLFFFKKNNLYWLCISIT